MKKVYRSSILLFLLLLFLNSVIIYESYYHDGVFSEENGLLENITAFAFVFSGVLLLFQSVNIDGFERRLTLFFSLTCFLCFVRELDLEDFNIPSLFQSLAHGGGRDLFFSLSYFCILVSIFLKDRVGFGAKLLACLASPVTKTVMLGSFMGVAGMICEEFHLQFVEELMEMNGSMVILLAAIIHLSYPIYKANLPARSRR